MILKSAITLSLTLLSTQAFASKVSAPTLTTQNSSPIHEIRFSEATQFPLNQEICIREGCYPGGMKPNQIAFTFDDGPGAGSLRILEVLEKHNIKATFFVHIGQGSPQSKKDILHTIAQAGHKVSNHGSSHSPLHRQTSDSTVVNLLMDTHHVIEPYLTRSTIPLYRNPGGYWEAHRARLLNAHPVLSQYVGPIYWNVGGDNRAERNTFLEAADWRCRSKGISANTCADGYFNKIISNHTLYNRGSLVLMHDIHPVTINSLDILITRLKQYAVNWEFILVQDIPAVRNAQGSSI